MLKMSLFLLLLEVEVVPCCFRRWCDHVVKESRQKLLSSLSEASCVLETWLLELLLVPLVRAVESREGSC